MRSFQLNRILVTSSKYYKFRTINLYFLNKFKFYRHIILYSFFVKLSQMSWVVQCPKHGAVVEGYHFQAFRELELHSTEKCDSKNNLSFLFELKEQ